VAGYKVGALEEILGSSECLGKDTTSLTDIIIDLLNDRKKRIKIGEDNYNKVVESFSVEKMVRKYDSIYKKYLSGN
jgi:glycosyltransferase involved in cell wall biosynthesis